MNDIKIGAIRHLIIAVLAMTLTGCNQSSPDAAAKAPPANASQASAAASTNSAPSSPPTQVPSADNAAPSTASAEPQVIVQETFQENSKPDNYYNNMELTGVKAAPVNLPGASWQLAAGDGTYESYITPTNTSGAGCFHHVVSAGLNLASNGTYVKPTIMTISAEVGFSGDTTEGTCLVGFYSALSGPHTGNVQANFTGLALQFDGSLQLVENGKPAGAPIKFTGDYDPHKGPVTIWYSVDTTKGTISNVSLTGSTSAYTITTTAFTNAATAFAGIGGTNLPSFCYFNNLKISSGIVLPPPPPSPPADSTQTNAP